jgi:hypothetical protein
MVGLLHMVVVAALVGSERIKGEGSMQNGGGTK